MRIRGLIDGFEDYYAILELEDGSYAKVQIVELPQDAREGDEVTIDEEVVEILF
ncbi:DUF3006 family protein [Alkaliphilus sp. B6464]|uniref:DUF3006 family protein n=1 Tax=Alkaliphilus sp. B6464 TaxID=2731219 RepID=UPI001BABB5B6|nr:DUF3006 family protein [Alkaliphilus sp. B6464]QUH21885.1 DUF3006 family protein [Alkaliphilus sp. B6464]